MAASNLVPFFIASLLLAQLGPPATPLTLSAAWAKQWAFADGIDQNQIARIVQHNLGSMPYAMGRDSLWDSIGRISMGECNTMLSAYTCIGI